MKKILLLIFFSSICFAQKTKKEILNDPNNNCVRTKNLSFNQISKLYPLNKSTKILLVSFPYSIPSINIETNEEIEVKNGLPKNENKIDYSKLIEYKALTYNNIYELLDIFFNYNFKPNKLRIYKPPCCYKPRNAIVFLNENDEIVDYIEICFTCAVYTYGKIDLDDNSPCQGKLDLIKNFFIQNGIK